MRKLVYLKAVVIVHGKSELQLCQYIKKNLKLKMEIESDKKGEKAIQITSLLNRTLNNKKFKNLEAFIKSFEDVELSEDGKELNPDFKIFIIMDTDDCKKEKTKQDYINKEMFKDHWAYQYIVPIYNSPNLEPVLEKAGIAFEHKGVKKKKEYIKIFPTDKKYEKTDAVQIEELSKNLSRVKDTNMEVFLDFCLKCKD